jgi:hypothetical protein
MIPKMEKVLNFVKRLGKKPSFPLFRFINNAMGSKSVYTEDFLWYTWLVPAQGDSPLSLSVLVPGVYLAFYEVG